MQVIRIVLFWVLVLQVLQVAAQQPESFIKQLEGSWKGMLQIYDAEQRQKQVPMSMSIRALSDSSYSWKTIYADGNIVKDYTLKSLTDASNHYLIDEGDGILLDAWHFDNSLLSWFAVEGQFLQCLYTLRGQELEFLIYAGAEKALNTTGGQGEIPEVRNFKATTMQRATLKRQ